MSIFLVDRSERLEASVEKVKAVEGVADVFGMRVDVSKVDEVIAMREKVLDEFGEVRLFPGHGSSTQTARRRD
jgi:hypothetical protein